MKDKPLEVIDESLIEAGEFLRVVEGDSNKMKCLEVFAGSLEVVEWIRNETKGIICVIVTVIYMYDPHLQLILLIYYPLLTTRSYMYM